LEFDADGFDSIVIQVVKLSEETCSDPKQELFEVLDVIVVVSIASEKVTDTVAFRVDEELSAGLVETTVGLIPSNTIFLFPPKDAELSSAGSIKSASLPAKSLMLPEFIERAFVEV